MTFWIGIACAEHTAKGLAGGFAQLGHGKHQAVKSLRKGDWIAYYSPSVTMGGTDKLRAFTSLGEILSEECYQVEQAPGFCPWRVDVAYVEAAKPAPIRPLLERLDLTRGRGARWGMAVRGPKARTTEADRQTIAAAMGVTLP